MFLLFVICTGKIGSTLKETNTYYLTNTTLSPFLPLIFGIPTVIQNDTDKSSNIEDEEINPKVPISPSVMDI